MAVIGIELDSDTLVLTKGRDFKWYFENLDTNGQAIDYPPGELYFELLTGGQHNALQEVRVIAASGGTYALTLNGETTAPIDYYDATVNPHGIDGDITDALVALPSVGPGNVFVHPAQLYPVWEINLTLNAGNNEFQQILVKGDGGTFVLRYAGYNTSAIAYGATAAAVQSALTALPSIGSGNVSVTSIAGGYRVEFVGTLAATDTQELVVPEDLMLLTGTDPSVEVSTTSPGSGALTEPIVNLINKYTNDFFNLFDSLLGVDIDFVVHSNTDCTLKVTSLKAFDEVSLITFAVDVTANAIESFFNTIAELAGLFNVINVDFYWNHVYQVEFIGDLGEREIPAMTASTSLLTGVNGEQTVEVEVLKPGKALFTKWAFSIVGSLASLKVESEAADLIQPRTHWQLVFLPDGELAGGDPIARGRVTVQA